MSAHKWWRVSNIIERIPTATTNITIAEINFINQSNISNDNVNNALSKSNDGTRLVKNAFDKDANTLTSSNSNEAKTLYWIGYKFDIEVEVTSISVKMRADMDASWGQEWQKAYVDYSDNGIDWTFYGIIFPLISQQDASIKTVPIIYIQKSTPISTIKFNKLNDILNKSLSLVNTYSMIKPVISNDIKYNLIKPSNRVKNILVKDNTSISDYVYEEGVPVQTILYLYSRATGELIVKTKSRTDGYFEFKNLDKSLEYIITSSDRKYQYKSIIKDYSNI